MIDVEKIKQYAEEIYTEDIDSGVYADEFGLYLQKIADKFPELKRDIFNNIENNDCGEQFYQIFINKPLGIDNDNYGIFVVEQFGRDWSSYEMYLDLVEYYVKRTIALLDYINKQNAERCIAYS